MRTALRLYLRPDDGARPPQGGWLDEGAEVSGADKAVSDALESFNLEYVKVKERSTPHTAKLAELTEVEKQHQAARQSLRAQRAELENLGKPEAEHASLMHSLFEQMATRSARLEEQCASLAEFSGGLLRGSLEKGHGFEVSAERFRGAVAGSGLRAKRLDEFFEALSAEDKPVETWEAAVNELEALTQLSEGDPVVS